MKGAFIRVTVSTETDLSNYVVKSTIECRILGILLYSKTYHYPPDGWHGEFFRN